MVVKSQPRHTVRYLMTEMKSKYIFVLITLFLISDVAVGTVELFQTAISLLAVSDRLKKREIKIIRLLYTSKMTVNY